MAPQAAPLEVLEVAVAAAVVLAFQVVVAALAVVGRGSNSPVAYSILPKLVCNLAALLVDLIMHQILHV